MMFFSHAIHGTFNLDFDHFYGALCRTFVMFFFGKSEDLKSIMNVDDTVDGRNPAPPFGCIKPFR